MNIDIRKCDVVETRYKASGPGGQHKSKTETAVRLFHRPTGIEARAASERSLSANRQAAWATLRARVSMHFEGIAADRKKARRDAKPGVSFGHAIRTYRLFPPATTKDHRTGTEHRTADVLDGDGLDGLILAGLNARLA